MGAESDPQRRQQSAASMVVRLFVALSVLASVATLTHDQSPAAAASVSQPIVGKLLIDSSTPADGDLSSNTRPASVALDPERIRTESGVTYPRQVARPEVFFTFDDGPDHLGVTDRILDLLKVYNAQATFFVVGRAADAFPDQIRRMVDEGHALGNHTYTHPRLTSLSDSEVRRQLVEANEALERLSGQKISCYRPPEAKVNDRVHAIAVELGIGNETWTAKWGGHWGLWDVDSWDWRQGQERTLGALDAVAEGDVVLMHSISPFSADIFEEWMEANQHRFDLNVLPGCMSKK